MRNILSYKLFERKDIERVSRIKAVMGRIFLIPAQLIESVWMQVLDGSTMGANLENSSQMRKEKWWFNQFYPDSTFTTDIKHVLNAEKLATLQIAPQYPNIFVRALASFSLDPATGNVVIAVYDPGYTDLVRSGFERIDAYIIIRDRISKGDYYPHGYLKTCEKGVESALANLRAYDTGRFKESIFHELVHYYDHHDTPTGFATSASKRYADVKKIVSKEEQRLNKEKPDGKNNFAAHANTEDKQEEVYYASNHEYNAHYLTALYSCLMAINKNLSIATLNDFIALFKSKVEFERLGKPTQQRMLKRLVSVWHEEIDPIVKGMNTSTN